MDVIDLPLGQIIPYARNPRRNEKAIATVAASIAEFGWRQGRMPCAFCAMFRFPVISFALLGSRIQLNHSNIMTL